jgi:3'-5' exoribonuclease
MEQPETQEASPHIWVEDLKENDLVEGLYLAKVKRLGTTRKGDPFLSVTLADRTGDVEARVWDEADVLSARFSEGDVISVTGRAGSYRNEVQLVLTRVERVEEVEDPALFLESSSRDVREMMTALRELLGTLQNRDLRRLTERFLADREFTGRFKKAPAAKNFHHGYLGGLLEHTLSVCELVDAAASHYPELDRDLLLCGAFLHDVGKIREYTYRTHIDYSDEGRLLGHVVLGAVMLEERLAALKSFPRELAMRLKHLVISHHGEFEFGSPKRPKFLEAFVLHLLDDLDAKVNGLGRFMARDRKEGAWTDFNRLFERYFLKGGIEEGDSDGPPSEEEVEKQRPLFSP